jgi:hypothetical protein
VFARPESGKRASICWRGLDCSCLRLHGALLFSQIASGVLFSRQYRVVLSLPALSLLFCDSRVCFGSQMARLHLAIADLAGTALFDKMLASCMCEWFAIFLTFIY